MNKNTGIIIGAIVVLLAAGGVYAYMSDKDEVMVEKKVGESAVMQKEGDTMMKNETMKGGEMMKKAETGMMDKSDVIMKGSYEAYASDKLARAESGDVVLFFHASWCPSCRSLNSDIEANVSLIPGDLSILKVDYDKETELKKKYGITYQHTLVQVDKNGNLIKKWSGSPKLSSIVSEIQ